MIIVRKALLKIIPFFTCKALPLGIQTLADFLHHAASAAIVFYRLENNCVCQ